MFIKCLIMAFLIKPKELQSILPVPTYVGPWKEWPSFGITLIVVIMLLGLNTFHFVEGMGLMPL